MSEEMTVEPEVILLVPKNSGLMGYREKAIASFKEGKGAKLIDARGEDIPFLVKQFHEKNKKAFGLTGEDLYKEYCLENRETGLKIVKRIEWDDESAMFRKPALCLIGPQGKSLETLPRNMTVSINAKYRKLAKKYLNFLERRGFAFKKIYMNGCVEASCSEGVADMIIDIVYTGSSLRKYGLVVLDRIMLSDYLVIGATDVEASVFPKASVLGMSKYVPPIENRKGKLRLDFNENTIGCSPRVLEALQNITAEDVCTYPAYSDFRKELAQWANVLPSQILMTNGTDEAIKIVMDAYLDKGDEVIIPQPTFSLFNSYAAVTGATIVPVLYNKDLSFPSESVLNAITSKTRIIVLVNPNNPTGTAISEQEIIRILEKAPQALVLVDEAYYQYYGYSCKELIKGFRNLVIIQTFSKAFGLAGMRFGYALSNEGIITNLEKVGSPYSVNALAIIAARAAIKDPKFVRDYVEEVLKNRTFMYDELQKLGIKTYPSQANFIIADFGARCKEVLSQLDKEGILIRDRSSFALLQNCLRLGNGTKEQCVRLLDGIKRILRKDTLLFDMDGVLIDVSASYRIAISQTVNFFTGQDVSPQDIQRLKEKGGYNNDWDLSQALIEERGISIPKQDIINKFQELYTGNGIGQGLRENEKWMLSLDVLKQAYKKFRLGIVTGRPKEEALYALMRFGVREYFDAVIAMEDYPQDKAKPDPYSIRLALEKIGGESAAYVGDSVDDIKAAKNAGITSIGVLPGIADSSALKDAFRNFGAKTIVERVNQVLEVFP